MKRFAIVMVAAGLIAGLAGCGSVEQKAKDQSLQHIQGWLMNAKRSLEGTPPDFKKAADQSEKLSQGLDGLGFVWDRQDDPAFLGAVANVDAKAKALKAAADQQKADEAKTSLDQLAEAVQGLQAIARHGRTAPPAASTDGEKPPEPPKEEAKPPETPKTPEPPKTDGPKAEEPKAPEPPAPVAPKAEEPKAP